MAYRFVATPCQGLREFFPALCQRLLVETSQFEKQCGLELVKARANVVGKVQRCSGGAFAPGGPTVQQAVLDEFAGFDLVIEKSSGAARAEAEVGCGFADLSQYLVFTIGRLYRELLIPLVARDGAGEVQSLLDARQ